MDPMDMAASGADLTAEMVLEAGATLDRLVTAVISRDELTARRLTMPAVAAKQSGSLAATMRDGIKRALSISDDGLRRIVWAEDVKILPGAFVVFMMAAGTAKAGQRVAQIPMAMILTATGWRYAGSPSAEALATVIRTVRHTRA